MLVDQIPQLQAQIAQISQALQTANLPNHVRRQTEMQHQQLQFQLSQAQTMAVALASFHAGGGAGAISNIQNISTMGGMGGTGMGFPAMAGFQQQQPQQQMNWNTYAAQQQQGAQDGAYQRLPVNNRGRRGVKRDRPSDFFDASGDAKAPRFWE